MAVIGQQLLEAESGWTRYDLESPLVTFNGTWTTTNSRPNNFTNGSIRFTTAINSSAVFNFNGYGIRLMVEANVAYDSNCTIEIGNEVYKFSCSNNTASYNGKVLVFEKYWTKKESRVVKIVKTSNDTKALNIDSVDVMVTYRRLILKNPTTNQHYSLAEKTLIPLTDNSIKNIISYGINKNIGIKLNEDFNKITTVNSDGTTTTKSVSPFSVYDYISETPQLLLYSELTDVLSVITTVEPFSVYDHISENPQAIIYTESTDDITVSTTTEPYDLYDEFGDEVEVLFYTDDVAVTESDLILEANWSPIDEVEGDFEVVTWTDEGSDTAQRALEMTAIPKPQFIKLANPKRLYGYLDDVLSIDASTSYRDEVRYLFTDDKAQKWYVWSFMENKFVEVNASTHENISANGMTYDKVNLLTQDNWRAWEHDYINIGIFLKDNPRDTIVSVVDSLQYQDYLPRNTTKISDTSLYILNTTARIDLQMVGNTLTGQLSDDDLTRVQYRVFLNGQPHFPLDGSFTNLEAPPKNIALTFSSKDIKVDEWNTLKVEFQDFFGTVDYWSTQFMGTYSGLMFKDVTGKYYSSEIGEVLQYLDFGMIIAGQTTIEHEIILKNQYGYDVKNLYLYPNTSNFPNGLTCQMSESLSPFLSQPELRFTELKNGEEVSFFIRLKSELGVTPDANGSFDIIVRADRA